MRYSAYCAGTSTRRKHLCSQFRERRRKKFAQNITINQLFMLWEWWACAAWSAIVRSMECERNGNAEHRARHRTSNADPKKIVSTELHAKNRRYYGINKTQHLHNNTQHVFRAHEFGVVVRARQIAYPTNWMFITHTHTHRQICGEKNVLDEPEHR